MKERKNKNKNIDFFANFFHLLNKKQKQTNQLFSFNYLKSNNLLFLFLTIIFIILISFILFIFFRLFFLNNIDYFPVHSFCTEVTTATGAITAVTFEVALTHCIHDKGSLCTLDEIAQVSAQGLLLAQQEYWFEPPNGPLSLLPYWSEQTLGLGNANEIYAANVGDAETRGFACCLH